MAIARMRVSSLTSRAGEDADDLHGGTGEPVELAWPANRRPHFPAGRLHNAVADQLFAKVAFVERSTKYAFIDELQLGHDKPWAKKVASYRGRLQLRSQALKRPFDNAIVVVGELADLGHFTPTDAPPRGSARATGSGSNARYATETTRPRGSRSTPLKVPSCSL